MNEQIISITDDVNDVKLVFKKVMYDIGSIGRMITRHLYKYPDSAEVKSVKFCVKECNEWYHCNICKKSTIDRCDLCYGCDTYNTWICKACYRDGDCPPCSIFKKVEGLTYTQLMAVEQQINAILDTYVSKESESE